MNHILQLSILLGVLGWTMGHGMVFGSPGACITKKAYGIFKMKKFECEIMGGAWNLSPADNDWIDCHMDLCYVGRAGRVIRRCGPAWGVDKDQKSEITGDDRTYGIIRMQKKECDVLGGRVNGNPGASEWTDCHLFMKSMNGARVSFIDSYVVCGVGECPKKVAYGILTITQQDCNAISGAVNSQVAPAQWTHCHLDLAQ